MNLKNKVVLSMLVVFPSGNGWASDKGMGPGMVALGPFDLIPMLTIQESYSDNIFHDNLNNPKGSLITQIRSGGELALRRKLDRYALKYSFLSSQYHASPTDDYVDHFFNGTAHFEITRRNHLDVSSGLTYGHNMRGTFFTQGALATQQSGPDQFHTYSVNGSYRYGLSDAPANLGLQMGWLKQVYDNDRARTASFDRTEFDVTPGFYYRLMPKTYLTAQIQNTVVEYPNSDNSAQLDATQFAGLDYTKQRYLLGVSWDQSSKTRGAFRIGYLQQEYDNADTKGDGGITWDGQLVWSPLTYSTLNMGLSRDVQPSIGAGFSRELQVYSAGWTHTWPRRVTTQVHGSYQEVLNQGSSEDTSGVSFRFDVNYTMRPWLTLGLNYSHSNFQALTNDTASTQNIVMFYVNAIPVTEASNEEY